MREQEEAKEDREEEKEKSSMITVAALAFTDPRP